MNLTNGGEQNNEYKKENAVRFQFYKVQTQQQK